MQNLLPIENSGRSYILFHEEMAHFPSIVMCVFNLLDTWEALMRTERQGIILVNK